MFVTSLVSLCQLLLCTYVNPDLPLRAEKVAAEKQGSRKCQAGDFRESGSEHLASQGHYFFPKDKSEDAQL